MGTFSFAEASAWQNIQMGSDMKVNGTRENSMAVEFIVLLLEHNILASLWKYVPHCCPSNNRNVNFDVCGGTGRALWLGRELVTRWRLLQR